MACGLSAAIFREEEAFKYVVEVAIQIFNGLSNALFDDFSGLACLFWANRPSQSVQFCANSENQPIVKMRPAMMASGRDKPPLFD